MHATRKNVSSRGSRKSPLRHQNCDLGVLPCRCSVPDSDACSIALSIARRFPVAYWRCQVCKCVCERTIPIIGRVLVTLRCDRTLMASSVHQLGLGRPGCGRPCQAGVAQVMEPKIVSTDGGPCVVPSVAKHRWTDRQQQRIWAGTNVSRHVEGEVDLFDLVEPAASRPDPGDGRVTVGAGSTFLHRRGTRTGTLSSTGLTKRRWRAGTSSRVSQPLLYSCAGQMRTGRTSTRSLTNRNQ